MKNQLRIWFYLRNLHLFESWLVCVTTTQQTHQRWYLVENETWVDVHLPTLFQRWQNNVEAMSIELCWFNVDEPMLFQRWNFVEIKSQADVCLSIKCRWPNVVLTLIFGWKWKLNQRIFIGVASKLRKQHSKNFVNCCTDLYWCSLESDSKTKQN